MNPTDITAAIATNETAQSYKKQSENTALRKEKVEQENRAAAAKDDNVDIRSTQKADLPELKSHEAQKSFEQIRDLILSKGEIAMLAQANSSPAQVMALLA